MTFLEEKAYRGKTFLGYLRYGVVLPGERITDAKEEAYHVARVYIDHVVNYGECSPILDLPEPEPKPPIQLPLF